MKKTSNFRSYRDLTLCIICLFLAFLMTMAGGRTGEEAMAARIAPEILRFHVLANSDSSEDQALKLNVRTYLLDTIYEELGSHATLDETKAYVTAHQRQLERDAEDYMAKAGYDYSAKLELTNCYFPTKTYGDMVFPCGRYDAVRVILGTGAGRNWWCVLYPPLCFVDSTYAVVPDSSKEVLKQSLQEQDYDALFLSPALQAKENAPKIKVRVKLKISDLFRQKEEASPKENRQRSLS